MYRCFRVRATGQWLEVLLTSAGPFSILQSSHLRDIAQGLAVSQQTLEIVEGNHDARTGTLLPLPTKPTPLSDKERFNLANTDSERIQVIAEVLALSREA